MKKAAIIAIGTEIIKGRIEDTNSTYISKWLENLGIETSYKLAVPDKIQNIVDAINFVSHCDIIIITGGLGPTSDDLTREALSKFLNKKLLFDEKIWEQIDNFFKKRNIPTPVSNKKQAMIIEGGEFIINHKGTAPGIFYKDKERLFFVLPGPPRENQPMLINFVEKKLYELGFIKEKIFTKILRVYNIGESQLAEIISNLKLTSEIGYYFTPAGWVEIHLTKKGSKSCEKEINEEFDKIVKTLKEKDLFFTPDVHLSKLLLDKLIEKKLTIAFAESMTGGALSGEFVSNSGASKVFLGGIIAYSNELKEKLLNVSNETLIKYGAVSEEVAFQMVKGLKEKIKADISVSVTGIAGPMGATEEKPIGLTYIGFCIKSNFFVEKQIFLGDRERIIKRCINFVFTELLKKV